MLKNIYLNNIRLGVLFIIYGITVFILQFIFNDTLAVIVSTSPLVAIYVSEIRGKLTYFKGITSSVLIFLAVAICIFLFQLHGFEWPQFWNYVLVGMLALAGINILGRVILLDGAVVKLK